MIQEFSEACYFRDGQDVLRCTGCANADVATGRALLSLRTLSPHDVAVIDRRGVLSTFHPLTL